jgi:hypothetical protein
LIAISIPIITVGWVAASVLIGLLAMAKGRSFVSWSLAAALASPVAVLLLVVLPKKRTMMIIRSAAFPALLVLFVLTASVIAQPAAISWPDAVGEIAGERAKAETCVALTKKYGDDAQKARGQITYTNAKADFDAVIAGLIVALSEKQTPASLSSLQEKLSGGASGLSQFCGTVINLLPKIAGQTEKGVGIDILKAIPLEQLLKMLSDGVSALYTNHRSDDALTRRTIQTQLESARWPAFSEVKVEQ